MICPHCEGKGLVRVAYQSGEVYDLGVCWCQAGQTWARFGEAVIRQRMQVPAEVRIAELAAFEEPQEAKKILRAGEASGNAMTKLPQPSLR